MPVFNFENIKKAYPSYEKLEKECGLLGPHEKAKLSIQYESFWGEMHVWENYFGKMAVLDKLEGFSNLTVLQKVFMDYALKFSKYPQEYGNAFKYPGIINTKTCFDHFEKYNPITMLSWWFTYSYFKQGKILNRDDFIGDIVANRNDAVTNKVENFRKLHLYFLQALDQFIQEVYKSNEDAFISAIKDTNIDSFKKHIDSFEKHKEKLIDHILRLQQKDAAASLSKDLLQQAFASTIKKVKFWNHVKELPNKFNGSFGIKVLVVCASVTAGLMLKKDNYPWPLEVFDKIKDYIRKEYSSVMAELIINHIPIFIEPRARSGDDSQAGVDFFGKQFPYNTKTKFDLITIGLAANDFLDGRSTDFGDFYNRYKTMITACRERNDNCHIIIAFPIPTTKRFGHNDDIKNKIQEINTKIEELNKSTDPKIKQDAIALKNNIDIFQSKVDCRNPREKIVDELNKIGKRLEKEFQDVTYVEIPTETLKQLDYPDNLHPSFQGPISDVFTPIFFKIINPIIRKRLLDHELEKIPKQTLTLLELHKSKYFTELTKKGETSNPQQQNNQSNRP